MQSKDKELQDAIRYTNLAYLCADIANTFALKSEGLLAKQKKEFHRDEKKKFSLMQETVKRLKIQSKDVAKCLYEIEDVDGACNVSDKYAELIDIISTKLVDDSSLDRIINKLKQIER